MLVISSSRVFAQLDKQQTLDYILQVYKEAHILLPSGNSPQAISCHYQTLIIQFKYTTTTSSLKNTLSCCFFEKQILYDVPASWYIGTRDKVSLGGIATEDECKRLYKALLHLQELLKDDKDSKDPFDN